MSFARTTHRTSREKSLPTEHLARQIKKQVFFKKSKKVDKEFQPIEDVSNFSYGEQVILRKNINFREMIDYDSDYDDYDYDDYDYDYMITMYHDLY